MDHIETKILSSYTIQEAAQNMVFAARLTLDTDICKMSDWLPHKMCTQHQKYQKGQLIFLVECHKVGSAKLRKEEHGTEEKKK